MTSGQDEILARMASHNEAKTLDLPPGVSVLEVLHTSFDQDGQPFEVPSSPPRRPCWTRLPLPRRRLTLGRRDSQHKGESIVELHSPTGIAVLNLLNTSRHFVVIKCG